MLKSGECCGLFVGDAPGFAMQLPRFAGARSVFGRTNFFLASDPSPPPPQPPHPTVLEG